MCALIAFLLVAIPVVEIWILIEVGGALGALPTVGLVLGTSALGALLLRGQALANVDRLRAAAADGRPPGDELLDGFILFIARGLVLTPGFLTDAAGFLLLVPPIRRALRGVVARRFQARANVFVASATFQTGEPAAPLDPADGARFVDHVEAPPPERLGPPEP